MKILLIASEMDGIVKTGGLADFSAALPKALAARGHNVRVVLPRYKQAVVPYPDPPPGSAHEPRTGPDSPAETVAAVPLQFNLNHTDRYGCLVTHTRIDGVSVRLVEHHDFFSRNGVYDQGGYAFADNPLRFGFLCKAALEICLSEQWIPDIVHCNDWQTALIPYYLKEHYAHRPELARSRSLLTIHNGEYQGKAAPEWIHAIGIPAGHFTSTLMEENGLLNLLKCGIMTADAVNAVSPGYRDELLKPETSHGLLWQYLNQRRDRFSGILNGCDYSRWNPSTDPYLPHPFSAKDTAGKALCKTELQFRMGLPVSGEVPLFGMVARLAQQKGFDYLIPALERLLYEDPLLQLALLGSGDPEYGSRLHHLQQRYPHKMSFVNGYDNELSHLIEAGSDFFVMPSLFEPCGLNQLYSLAYGTLPIVRETGGLKDTVIGLIPDHANAPPAVKKKGSTAASGIPASGTGVKPTAYATGISFIHADNQGCYWALKQAASLFLDHPHLYRRMQRHAMDQLFTWEASASEYEALYKSLLET